VSYLLSLPAGVSRPAAVRQPAIAPPFDPSDPGGTTWTSLPLGYVVPTARTKAYWLGDLGGVTLPIAPPLVPGGNTTPATMTLSFLLPWYLQPQYGGTAQVDQILTAHAQRGYQNFHLARDNWLQAGLSDVQGVQLLQTLNSWGFYGSYWGISTTSGPNFGSWAQAAPYFLPTLHALQAAGAATCEQSILIVGEELNRCTSPTGLLDIVTNLSPLCQGSGIAMGLHFTSNYPAWPTAGQTSTQFWQDMLGLGVTYFCWQADQNDPAGTQAAHMYDSRRYCADAGGAAIIFVAFELMATAQLYGACTEQQGQLRSWECNCAPTGGYPNMPPVSGAGNGLVMPNGQPMMGGA
jgi:hypothetical protein